MRKYSGWGREVFSFLGVAGLTCFLFTLMTQVCVAENSLQHLYELAKADKWDALIKDASSMLQDSPQLAESREFLTLIAQAYYEVGEYRKAVDAAHKLRQEAPSRQVGLFLAECMIRAGEAQKATGIIAEESKRSGWDGELYYWMGEALFAQGLFEEAEEYFRKACAKDSRIKTWALYSLGYTLFEEGKLEEALEVALKAAREGGTEAVGEAARVLAGGILIAEGRYDDALKILEGVEGAKFLQVKAYIGKGQSLEAIDTAEKTGILEQTAGMFEEERRFSAAAECLERTGDKELSTRIALDYLLHGSAGDAIRVCSGLGSMGKAVAGWIYYLWLGDAQSAASAFAGAGDEELGILGRACIAYDKQDWQGLAEALEELKNTSFWSKRAKSLLALAYLRMGEYEKAVEEAQDIADEGVGRLILGEAYYRQGKYLDAREVLGKAYGEEARYGEGWALLQLGRIDEAVRVFAQIKGARREEAVLAVGYGLWRAGRADDAIECLLQVRESKLLREKALWIVGWAQEQKGRFDAAWRVYDEVAEEGDFAEAALIKGAEMRMLGGNYEDGVKKYREFLSKYPRSRYRYHAIMGIGWGLMKLGHFEEAKEAFAQVWGELRRDAVFGEGLCLLMSGDKAGAAAKFAECVKLGMDGALVDWLGKFYFDEKRYDDVVDLVEYGSQKVGLLAGWACLERGEYTKAEKLLSSLLDGEFCGEAGMGLYYLYRTLDRVEDGVKVLLEVEGKLGGGMKRWVELSLGEAFLRLGKNRVALAHLGEACSEEKDLIDAVARFLIGKLYEQVRNFRGALSEYLNVYYLSPQREWRLISGLRAGLVYEKMGKLEKASSIYAGIAELDPAGLYGAQARERLEMLSRQEGEL